MSSRVDRLFGVTIAAVLAVGLQAGCLMGGGDDDDDDDDVIDAAAGGDAGSIDAEPVECETSVDCDDGLACNGEEVCVGATGTTPGTCAGGTPVPVDDGVDCTVDTCDAPTGTVQHTPSHADCDDGVACNGIEQCDLVLGCVPGEPPTGVDADGDGVTPADGDCDDCDPLVSPALMELPGNGIDDDCSGAVDEAPPVCDAGLLLDDTSATSAASALGLCRLAVGPADWGLISAAWVRANATVFAPGTQVGLQQSFGGTFLPVEGATAVNLSTGRARTVGQASACGSHSCESGLTIVTPPAGFPQEVPGCAGGTSIRDDVALEVRLRTPGNATGFRFASVFATFEFPKWVCTQFNDQFVVLMTPAPVGSINGNVLFDSLSYPMSANAHSITVCDPASQSLYATGCSTGCPSAPSPYCPSGGTALAGTGFAEWTTEYAGAAGWLQTTVPVTPGEEIVLRFLIWDTGDGAMDSSALIDGFEWLTGDVQLATVPL